MKRRRSTKKRTRGNDIISVILQDHQPLKQLIKVLKDEETAFDELKSAFGEFKPLLAAHAKPEEQILYKRMKQDTRLRSEGFEGDVEHGLADQMMEEAQRTADLDLFRARVKVLAELVEHHIKEEERKLLPNFKKRSASHERQQLAEAFLQAKEKFQAAGGDDAPAEALIEMQAH